MFLCLKKRKKEYRLFKNLTGICPGDPELYRTALRHKSACNHKKSANFNNERLEFLGDSVLETIVSEYLYNKYPKLDEGMLTRMRAGIVKRESLNRIAKNMGLHNYLEYDMHSVNYNKTLNGNALEALVGAVFIDKGYKKCCQFVENKILTNFNFDEFRAKSYDPKSTLYHHVQRKKWEIEFISYENIEENENIFHFISQIKINGRYVAEGKGWTKKEAQQDASVKVLKRLNLS